MALTRERKILLVVLGIGGMALLMDRVLLNSGGTGPHSAAADAAQTDAAQISAANASTAQINGPTRGADTSGAATFKLMDDAGAGPMLDQRLKDAAEAQGLSPAKTADAFAAPRDWIEDIEPKQSKPASQSKQMDASGQPDPGVRFRKRHLLMAVMTNQGDGVAIIDGEPIHVGEQLDGFTLKHVQRRKATFVSGAVRVELTLPEGR